MNDINNPWHKEIKRRTGQGESPIINFRRNTVFWQAVEEMAKRESVRYGVSIPRVAILQNLTTRKGAYFTARRTELAKRYKQLNREKQLNGKKYLDIK